MAKIAIVLYSMYGHVAKMAEAEAAGAREAGADVTIFQVPETLNDEVLALLHAPPKPEYPTITPEELVNYDAFIFGFPTRFGTFPAQWKTFWDATGTLWASGALYGKYASVFISTGTPGGGQETTPFNFLSTLSHHGIIFCPLGYATAFPQLTSFEEVHGSSPWGAGTFAGTDGSRSPSDLELKIATIQGTEFAKTVAKAVGGTGAAPASAPAAAAAPAKSEKVDETAKAAAEQNSDTGCCNKCIIS
ncbi:hypothetical protein CANCADRAFT_30755 [Tortispora caseinolytica NRRL Y-17796]|uniref:Flavodoxin-like domain-containing protein n=1 Tax=Tortispora caseinolytica NRRL Y-17796 TaxID=767744 RepID=A0A1E4TLN2_9ASCO|nr:hypothetical protein CANCADRAFT_30755 [Tortispora caseinolytica NRRL Y-17796]